MAKRKKNPWIAAILNFILYGLGYLYLGKRRALGGGLLVSDVILSIFLLGSQLPGTTFAGLTVGFLIMGLALAYDAYREAK